MSSSLQHRPTAYAINGHLQNQNITNGDDSHDTTSLEQGAPLASFRPLPSPIYHAELDLTIEFMEDATIDVKGPPRFVNAAPKSRTIQLYTPAVFNRSTVVPPDTAAVRKSLDTFTALFDHITSMRKIRAVFNDLLECRMLCDLPAARWSFGLITISVWFALDDFIEDWWSKGRFDDALAVLRHLKNTCDTGSTQTVSSNGTLLAGLSEQDAHRASEFVQLFQYLCDNCHTAFSTRDLVTGFKQAMSNTCRGLVETEAVVYQRLAAEPDRFITHDEWVQKRWVSSGQAFCAIFYYPDVFDITLHSDFDLAFALCSQLGCLYNDITSYLADRKSGDRTSWVLARQAEDGIGELEALHAAARACNEYMYALEFIYRFTPLPVRPILWANIYTEILILQAAKTRRYGWRAIQK